MTLTKNHYDPVNVTRDMMHSLGIHTPGIYLLDDNHKIADGPFATWQDAEARATTLNGE